MSSDLILDLLDTIIWVLFRKISAPIDIVSWVSTQE